MTAINKSVPERVEEILDSVQCSTCNGEGVCVNERWIEWNQKWTNNLFPLSEENEKRYAHEFLEFWGVPEFSKSLPPEEYQCDDCNGVGKRRKTKEEQIALLTSLLTETDQQARETEREKIANELVDILPVGTVDAFAILKAIEAYQKVLRTPNPPSQV